MRRFKVDIYTDAFFLYLKVCTEVLYKDKKIRESDLQVAVEVKGGIESDFACTFAKACGKGEEICEANFSIAVKVGSGKARGEFGD